LRPLRRLGLLAGLRVGGRRGVLLQLRRGGLPLLRMQALRRVPAAGRGMPEARVRGPDDRRRGEGTVSPFRWRWRRLAWTVDGQTVLPRPWRRIIWRLWVWWPSSPSSPQRPWAVA